MRISLIVAALFATSLSAVGQTPSVADEVRALDRQLREAAIRGESAPLDEKYTASEYVSINPGGMISTRQESLARVKSKDVKLQAIDVDQEEVHVYSNIVIVTGREHVRGSFKEHPFASNARYSRVWMKQKEGWKLILFQETPLPAEAQ